MRHLQAFKSTCGSCNGSKSHCCCSPACLMTATSGSSSSSSIPVNPVPADGRETNDGPLSNRDVRRAYALEPLRPSTPDAREYEENLSFNASTASAPGGARRE